MDRIGYIGKTQGVNAKPRPSRNDVTSVRHKGSSDKSSGSAGSFIMLLGAYEIFLEGVDTLSSTIGLES